MNNPFLQPRFQVSSLIRGGNVTVMMAAQGTHFFMSKDEAQRLRGDLNQAIAKAIDLEGKRCP